MAKFLHAMIRTTDPKASIEFYTEGLGLNLIQQKDYPEAGFSLYFLGETETGPMVELTHNHDDRDYQNGDQFGHLAYQVDNIYEMCEHLQACGVTILRPPRDGRMAFVKDPNGISIELLQKGPALELAEPWQSMASQGSW
ncbi:MAG: lactoylglutathione lyase [Gammaproteobacteria bacterium]|nr:lactoylglutathione lyase [Gammaproteobacteria bacterium]NVK89005.1 lactoylglutathione lyase [Gammaproteobacteria bacterium]